VYEELELEIQQCIQDKLESVRADFKAKQQITLLLPVSYVSIEDGSFVSRGQSSSKETVSVFVEFEFKNLKDEKDRRKGAYPILRGIVKYLAFQSFGLKITPMEPVKWQHITDAEDVKAGIKRYLITLKTSFYTAKALSGEEAGDLLRIGLNYYLDPARIAASDLVETRDTE
jgi:hypothetical protein